MIYYKLLIILIKCFSKKGGGMHPKRCFAEEFSAKNYKKAGITKDFRALNAQALNDDLLYNRAQ